MDHIIGFPEDFDAQELEVFEYDLVPLDLPIHEKNDILASMAYSSERIEAFDTDVTFSWSRRILERN